MITLFLIIGLIVSLLLSFSIHEWSHAYVAYYLGDPSAKYEGRLSLNPLVHIDKLGGAVLLISTLFSFGSAPMGWGKPVNYDSKNFKDPVFDSFLVAFAGPFSNILLALTWAILLAILQPSSQGFLYSLCYKSCVLNLAFALFNALPWPPLDGWKFLISASSGSWKRSFLNLEQKAGVWSIAILLVLLIIIGPWTFQPLLNTLSSLLLGGLT